MGPIITHFLYFLHSRTILLGQSGLLVDTGYERMRARTGLKTVQTRFERERPNMTVSSSEQGDLSLLPRWQWDQRSIGSEKGPNI